MTRLLGLASVVCAVALATGAAAQQPTSQTGSDKPIVTEPVVVTHGQVETPPVAATVPNEIIPPVQVATASPQDAPYKPAPLGTWIETTADKRLFITQTGYEITTDINGRRDTSIAMLTEGLGGGQVFPPSVPAEFWPLQVGKTVTFNYGAGSPLTVTAQVLRTETIKVPAGTFFTYVIERRSHPTSDYSMSVATFWYAPSIGAVVKETSFSPNGGGPRPYEAVLVVLPHMQGDISITVPGDSPENRQAFCNLHGTTLALPDGRSLAVPCVTYIQANLPAYQIFVNGGGEAASVPVTR